MQPGPPSPTPAQTHQQPAPRNAGSAELLMVSLSRFYAQRQHMQAVLPYITSSSGVSLRLIDWFVTNYAKKHNVVLTRAQQNNVVHFNVHLSYRAQLKAYSKQQFDPFRRRDRIVFYYERSSFVETTIGQLNFFRWLLQNDLLGYIEAHAAEIEEDMLAASGAAAKAAAREQQQQQQQAHKGGAPPSGHEEAAAATGEPDEREREGGGQQQLLQSPRHRRHAPPPLQPQPRPAPAQAQAQAEEATGQGSTRRRADTAPCRAAQNLTRMVGPRTILFD